MNVLHDVTPTSLIYSTNRRNEVDMDIVVRDLDSGEETVVFDDGGYVVQTSVSHDESSVAVTALSLQPNGTVVSLAGRRQVRGLGRSDRSPTSRPTTTSPAGRAGDDGLVVVSDHDRDFHAVWRLDLDGSWRLLVEHDEHDLGAAALARRHRRCSSATTSTASTPWRSTRPTAPTASTSTSSPSSRCRCAGPPTAPAS